MTSALTEGGAIAGVARPVGVLAGVIAAWRRAPFVLVVIIAAATAGNVTANAVYSTVCLYATPVSNQWAAKSVTGSWTVN